MPQKTRKQLLQHIAYVTNVGLSLRRAIAEKDAAGIKEYGDKLFSLADGQPNEFKG